MPSDAAGNAAKRVLDRSPGPWKKWRIRSRHGRAIKFIETYCRAPKGRGHGQPMRLGRFQKEFLEEALADNVDVGILQTPRGNGKSTGGGGLATWAAFDDDETGSPQVPIIATTVGQAIRSIYGVAVAMIEAEPELRNRSLVYTGIATPRIVVPFNGAELFPISNDPDGLQGLDPSLALVDEIGFQPIESWDSLRYASGKRDRSLTLGLGTPGLNRDNALYQIRQAYLEAGGLPGVVFREYAAPLGCSIDDRKAWRTANPAIKAGFLRVSALETDLGIARAGAEGHFRIFRLGQWYDGVDSWLGPNGRAIWDRLGLIPHKAMLEAPTWVGVDVGLVRDSTAVVWVQRRPDGKLHAWCKLWVPQRDEPVDVTDVMAHLRELAKMYRVEAIAYDKRFFDVPAKMLSDERLPMVEIAQSPERMTPILGSLLELIKRGDIRHDGETGLTTHVFNAKMRINERGFTLEKAKSRGRIDGVIALGLAVDRAIHARKPVKRPRSVML